MASEVSLAKIFFDESYLWRHQSSIQMRESETAGNGLLKTWCCSPDFELWTTLIIEFPILTCSSFSQKTIGRSGNRPYDENQHATAGNSFLDTGSSNFFVFSLWIIQSLDITNWITLSVIFSFLLFRVTWPRNLQNCFTIRKIEKSEKSWQTRRPNEVIRRKEEPRRSLFCALRLKNCPWTNKKWISSKE